MTNTVVAEYRAARTALRKGEPLPLMAAERRAALMLAEAFHDDWPAKRRDAGYTDVRRQLREAWHWDVAEQYRFPQKPRKGYALLVRPTGKCGNCGTNLRDGQETFCSQRCRVRFKRHGPGSAVRHCRGCATELAKTCPDIYCPDCRESRTAKAHLTMEDAWDRKPCAVPDCAGVAEGEGEGRPPKYCYECGTPAAKMRRRRAAKKAAGK